MDGRPNLRLCNVILDVQITPFGPKSLYGFRAHFVRVDFLPLIPLQDGFGKSFRDVTDHLTRQTRTNMSGKACMIEVTFWLHNSSSV